MHREFLGKCQQAGLRLAIFGAALVIGFGCLSAPSLAQDCKVRLGHDPQHRVEYRYGGSTYSEAFENHQWVAQSWGFVDKQSLAQSHLPAFEIRIKTQPTPGSEPGMELTSWDYVGAKEVNGAECTTEVELASRQIPISIKLHTFLDGTPVLTRWIEVTRSFETRVSPSAPFSRWPVSFGRAMPSPIWVTPRAMTGNAKDGLGGYA